MEKKTNINDFEAQAQEILDKVKGTELEYNFLFKETFNNYIDLLKYMKSLKEIAEQDGAMISKEYVKGRENLYVHPALKEYNKCITNANRTVETLLKIIRELKEDKGEDALDPLLDLMNSGDDDES